MHAISKGAAKMVRIILEHPNYIAGAETARILHKDPFFRDEEKSQFPPDVSPLILAAHCNNHEVCLYSTYGSDYCFFCEFVRGDINLSLKNSTTTAPSFCDSSLFNCKITKQQQFDSAVRFKTKNQKKFLKQ